MFRPFPADQDRLRDRRPPRRLQTRHGMIETPIFMPVGTQGTVKALTPAHLQGDRCADHPRQHLPPQPAAHLGTRPRPGRPAQIHGLGRPDPDRQRRLSGLLAGEAPRHARRRGRVPIAPRWREALFSGRRRSWRIQQNLGSDIAMVIDECPPWPCEKATNCARPWRAVIAGRQQCKQIATDSGFLAAGHHVFAIVQGSTFDDLRREAAESLAALDFPGYAVGGVSVGEPEPEMLKQVGGDHAVHAGDKPRYTMGLGTPPQLLKMIALGVDMFDCVLPSRVARNGLVFTPDGPINLRNEKFRTDPRPIATRARQLHYRFLPGLPAPPDGGRRDPELHAAHAAQSPFLPRSDGPGPRAHRGGRLRPVAPRLDRALRGGRRGAARVSLLDDGNVISRRRDSRCPLPFRSTFRCWMSERSPSSGPAQIAVLPLNARLSLTCASLSPAAPASSAPISATACSETAMRSSASTTSSPGGKATSPTCWRIRISSSCGTM
jgi:queuine tRNA-ribosyltransferase